MFIYSSYHNVNMRADLGRLKNGKTLYYALAPKLSFSLRYPIKLLPAKEIRGI